MPLELGLCKQEGAAGGEHWESRLVPKRKASLANSYLVLARVWDQMFRPLWGEEWAPEWGPGWVQRWVPEWARVLVQP